MPLGYGVSIPESVVFRRMAAETVLLDLQSGRYFGLNATAGRIFELLSEHQDADRVARLMSEETGQPEEVVAKDLDELCGSLAEQGLIRVDTAA